MLTHEARAALSAVLCVVGFSLPRESGGMTSRSDWMLPGGSVFVKPQGKKPPGRSATQTMLDVEALTEFAPRECAVVLPVLLGLLSYTRASRATTVLALVVQVGEQCCLHQY